MHIDGASKGGALAAKSRKFKPGFRGSPRDGASSGEIARDQNTYKRRDMSKITCFKCKQNGHFMSKCPSDG